MHPIFLPCHLHPTFLQFSYYFTAASFLWVPQARPPPQVLQLVALRVPSSALDSSVCTLFCVSDPPSHSPHSQSHHGCPLVVTQASAGVSLPQTSFRNQHSSPSHPMADFHCLQLSIRESLALYWLTYSSSVRLCYVLYQLPVFLLWFLQRRCKASTRETPRTKNKEITRHKVHLHTTLEEETHGLSSEIFTINNHGCNFASTIVLKIYQRAAILLIFLY